MKRLVFFMMLFILLPCAVSADFQTQENYSIPDAQYNRLKKFYSDTALYVMPYDKYESLINSDINFDDEVTTETVYIYTVCDNRTGECDEMQLTEEEYNAGDLYLPAMYKTSTYSTSSKQLTLSLGTPNSFGTVYFTLSNTWGIMPTTRSFDVIGVRIGNFYVVNGTQTGLQIYKENGTYHQITYAANGTNISNQALGFGISMNLVNNNITELQNYIEGCLVVNALPAVIYGSYQHAIVDVDLATSKSYTIGSGGLGSVFNFYGSIGNYYDHMGGTYLDIISY